MRRRPLLLLPALLAACEALPPAESARLPPGSVDGVVLCAGSAAA